MELYVNGQLDTFLANAGPMASTSKEITFGKKDVAISNYFLRGTLDEVRIYDEALAPNEIETLMTLWAPDEVTSLADEIDPRVTVYPNPASGTLYINKIKQPVLHADLTDITGRTLDCTYSTSVDGTAILEYDKGVHGLMILRIETSRGLHYVKIMAE